MRLRPLVKAVVTWQPLNRVLTSVLRRVLPATVHKRAFLARVVPRAGEVAATLPDGSTLRMSSRGDDGVATSLYWHGWAGYEPETAEPFLALATTARVTLDIGAHVGYFTLLAARANPDGRVYAFEPLPRVFERLTANVRLNGLTNVTCAPAAAGSPSGTAEFFHVKDRIPSSSSLSRRFMHSIEPTEQLTSSTVTVLEIDEFAAANDLGVDLVKIDTETTEANVLKGMAQTLERDRPVIVCEVLETEVGQEIERILQPHGYRWSRLTPAGEVPCEHIVPDERWLNFIFRPAAR